MTQVSFEGTKIYQTEFVKFECKKIYLFQFLNEKNYKYVADLNFQIFPDTVLLFELRMRHPALRVTKNIKNN